MSKGRLGRRLDRIAGALAARPAARAEDEGRELAAEVGRAFGRLVGQYREHFGLAPGEARARAANVSDPSFDHALTGPTECVSWLDLGAIAQRDPDRAAERWEQVKAAARGEVTSGHRAARALEGLGTECWGRARFLAVRAELSAAWRPRNAAEQQLVDQLAQWQVLQWHWLEAVTAYADAVFNLRRRPPGRHDPTNLPRLEDADALERAAQMVERFHRMYDRTLRALRELRRRPPVVVRGAGQVNIGDQQVNVAGPSGSFPAP